MIKLLQINLNNCRAAQDLMLQVEKEYQFDMTLMTEPYKVPEDPTWTSSTNDTACIHWRGDGHMNICTKKKQGPFSTSVLWRDIIIISCYISPNVDDCIFEEFLDELDNNVMDAQGYNVILGGNFNSKSTMWGCTHTNSRGDRLEWCANRDLVIMNF